MDQSILDSRISVHPLLCPAAAAAAATVVYYTCGAWKDKQIVRAVRFLILRFSIYLFPF
jgi:hypothetical protein